jgi:hypothetical protein
MHRAKIGLIGLAAALLLVSIANSETSNVKIYRCHRHGVVEYADRPCGQESSAVLADSPWLSAYTPVVTPQTARDDAVIGPRARSGSRTSSSPKLSSREQRRASCAAVQARLDRTESLLRAGYRGRRGERLRQDWRDLKDRYYALRCLGVH